MAYLVIALICLVGGGLLGYELAPKIEAEKKALKSQLEALEKAAQLDAAGLRARLAAIRKAL